MTPVNQWSSVNMDVIVYSDMEVSLKSIQDSVNETVSRLYSKHKPLTERQTCLRAEAFTDIALENTKMVEECEIILEEVNQLE